MSSNAKAGSKSQNVYFDHKVHSFIAKQAKKNRRSFSAEVNFTFEEMMQQKKEESRTT